MHFYFKIVSTDLNIALHNGSIGNELFMFNVKQNLE